jgi:hypothetical protein
MLYLVEFWAPLWATTLLSPLRVWIWWATGPMPLYHEPMNPSLTTLGMASCEHNKTIKRTNKTKEIHATKCATKPKKTHSTQFKIKFFLSAFQVC